MADNYVQFDQESMTMRFGSAETIYTERLTDGRLLYCGLTGNGIPGSKPEEIRETPSFDLVINGITLDQGWLFDHCTLVDTECTLTLQSELLPLSLEVITLAGNNGCFERRMTVCNLSDTPLTLTSVVPFKGIAWVLEHNFRENIQDNTIMPFSVGRFWNLDWGYEGAFEWNDIRINQGVYAETLRGQSGHSSPFLIMRNNIYGGHFLVMLEWSANWRAEVFTELMNIDAPLRNRGVFLNFGIMPVTKAPLKIIRPGERIDIPSVIFALSYHGFDSLIQGLHAFERDFIFKKPVFEDQPVIYNNSGYMVDRMTEEKLYADIDIASDIGSEMYVIDAGWHSETNEPWFESVGDWEHKSRLPNDLFPVFNYARSKGLKCGLWVEIEAAAPTSKIAKEHPDWFVTRYGKAIERQLDLAKPEVAAHVELTLETIIEKYSLNLLRTDFNMYPFEGGTNIVCGIPENNQYSHIQAIYGIFDRIGLKYPLLQLENCCGGGGRTDCGMVRRFTTTWTSDWCRLPRAAQILNGMTMTLPPEYVGRNLAAGGTSAKESDIASNMHAVILGHPCILMLTPSLSEGNPCTMRAAKKYIKIYKEFIRPFIRHSLVYHHTPVIEGFDGRGWCVLEYVSEDRTRAVAGIFRLSEPEECYRMRFRGLDLSLEYHVSLEPAGLTFSKTGYELSQAGFIVDIMSPNTSVLIILKSKEY